MAASDVGEVAPGPCFMGSATMILTRAWGTNPGRMRQSEPRAPARGQNNRGDSCPVLPGWRPALCQFCSPCGTGLNGATLCSRRLKPAAQIVARFMEGHERQGMVYLPNNRLNSPRRPSSSAPFDPESAVTFRAILRMAARTGLFRSSAAMGRPKSMERATNW